MQMYGTNNRKELKISGGVLIMNQTFEHRYTKGTIKTVKSWDVYWLPNDDRDFVQVYSGTKKREANTMFNLFAKNGLENFQQIMRDTQELAGKLG